MRSRRAAVDNRVTYWVCGRSCCSLDSYGYEKSLKPTTRMYFLTIVGIWTTTQYKLKGRLKWGGGVGGGGEWEVELTQFTNERLIAYYCSSFYFCLCVALADWPLGWRGAGLIIQLQPICLSSPVARLRHSTAKRPTRLLGPQEKRLCISVINLLVPTRRQQEIADFSSLTLGQSTAQGGPHSESAGVDWYPAA